MSDYTLTPNYSLYKPTLNADGDQWGNHWNLNADTIDSVLYTGLGSALTYTATGGTTARRAQDRSGQVIDIRDLGAACDGVTDDTAAWTAAFAKPNGTVIRIPQNCVTMIGDGNFRAPGGRTVSIVGDGKGSIIRLIPGTALVNEMFTWGTPHNLRIENLTIDFNHCPQPAALRQILAILSGTDVLVRNVSIINASANLYMISITSCSDFIVENCYCQLTTGSSTVQNKGIVTLASLGPCYRGRIVNNVCVNTDTGFGGCNQFYIAGNDISGWGVGGGITTDVNGTYLTIIGNSCHDSLTANDVFGITPNGIECWSLNTVISNNKCWNCAGAGISVGGVRSQVIGNLCWDNNTGSPGLANAGIMAVLSGTANASGSVFVGNYCYDSGVNRQGYGFRVNNNGLTNLTLNSNRFSGYQGDVQLGNATFLTNTDYVIRTLAADPVVPLGAATKQYVDGRGVGNRMLYQGTALVGNGADLTQDVLQTYTVPANMLANVGDRLIVRAGGTFIGSTDSKTVQIRWGGGNVGGLIAAAAPQQAWKVEAEIIKTAANAQTISVGYVTNSNSTSAGVSTTTRTDTTALAIDVTGQNATNPVASSITCRYFTVDYVAAA